MLHIDQYENSLQFGNLMRLQTVFGSLGSSNSRLFLNTIVDCIERSSSCINRDTEGCGVNLHVYHNFACY